MALLVSVIIAAHNEGDHLARTIESVIVGLENLDYEVVVADDASTDGSVRKAQRQFPRTRIVQHSKRLGTSPAKALGAENARGEVFVFLDAHSKPEVGATERLVKGVQRMDGRVIMTPKSPLWTKTPGKKPSATGNGYGLVLETLDLWWRTGRLYESPALIGRAFAISRELYAKLWGFDKHMRSGGLRMSILD